MSSLARHRRPGRAGSEPAAADAARRHDRIVRDSIALVGSYALTALVGVGFWALAARTIPASRLGVDTAIISAFTSAAAVAATGVANAILAMLPLAGPAAGLLVRRGYALTLCLSFGSGFVAGVLVQALLPGRRSAPTVILGVTAACMVWALFAFQDPVLTATGRAHWLLFENIPVNLAKLAMLPMLTAVAGSAANPAVFATLTPAAAAVIVVSGVLVPRIIRQRAGAGRQARAAGRAWMRRHRRTFGLFVVRDGAASAMTLGLYLALPFVVTAVSGPVSGAVFAVCLQVSQGLDLITAGVGVSLTTNVADDPLGAPATANRIWRRVAILVAVAAVALIAAGPLVLVVLGPTYLHRNGFEVLAVLAAGSALRSTFVVWAALLRAQRRTSLLLRCNSAGAVLLLGLVLPLARSHNAVGAALGVMGAACAFGAAGAIGLRRATARVAGQAAEPLV